MELSKERLLNLEQFNDKSDSPANAEMWEVREMARRLLAAEEQQPVAWRYRVTDIHGDLKPGWKFSDGPSLLGLYEPLYLHLQQGKSVQVPDEMYWQDAPVEGSTRAAAYATGWNACRAAMLKHQSSNQASADAGLKAYRLARNTD